jgi:hypothetical protein
MNIQEVESSVIASVGHDADRDVLEVRFRSGRVYNYRAVPADVYAALLAAESIGRYFNEVIRVRYEGELVYDPRRGFSPRESPPPR